MNTTTIGKAKFCPACHSPAVEFGAILAEQAPASCTACGWKGHMSDLLTAPYVHNMGGEEEVLRNFVNDFRNLMSRDCGVFIGRWLTRWGFLPKDPKEMSKVLAKYISAIAKASISAVVKTREEIEKEKARG